MSTSIQIADRKTNSSPDVPELIYTAPQAGEGVIIDSFTAANNSTANAAYKAYIIPFGGVVENPLRPYKIVVWGNVDLGAGIANQLIPPRAALYVEQTAAGAIRFTISGRQM